MPTAYQIKEQAITDTPLFLFDCQFDGGLVERWSSHQVTIDGATYSARVVRHNLFEIQTASDQGIDGIPRVSIVLANADSHFSEIELTAGFKGASLVLKFVFFDLKQGLATTPAMVLFKGVCNPPDEIAEATLQITAINRMNMHRVLLPQIRVERRCPWDFPSTPEDRQEASDGGARGTYSRFYRCGYSPDIPGGAGNLNGAAAYTSCGFTRTDCQARGMFSQDQAQNATRRFGGIEFVPSVSLVRSYGEQGRHLSPVLGNEARYNDFVPLIYGTNWFSPPIIFARNDGNLTRMEVLIGTGEINQIVKVLVNDIEIPIGQSGANMTGTGWFNTVSSGTRSGGFNPDFRDAAGNPLGDPYGNMTAISVVVPNRINDGRALPTIKALVEGVKLPKYATDGSFTVTEFTRNPAWIILDVLRRCGWDLEEIDVPSFARAAAFADELIQTQDLHGNPIHIPRFECNVALKNRRSAGDLIRGIRNACRLYLTYGANGLLELNVENAIALQQPSQIVWSNSTSALNGGWASYEFGDGSSGVSGILRRQNGEPTVRLWCRSITDTPNRLAVEFQDSLNEYQQDSYSVTDIEDVLKAGQEITTPLTALGIPNYDQAARMLKFNLDKSIRGNTYIEFETTAKALGLRPGDLITVTYLKEGFNRQLFRILKIAPTMNYGTAAITAQIHDDAWYSDTNGQTGGNSGARRQPGAGVGVPRPLIGSLVDADGAVQFGVSEVATQASDGSQIVQLTVQFSAPGALSPAGPAIPLLSLAAAVSTSGGTLSGGTSLYYAISAVNSTGLESNISFVVRATIPPGSNTNSVTLTGLSFPGAAASFHVYRGTSPMQLYRIADGQPLAGEFTDSGLTDEIIAPPDSNYDHANFYWRLEQQPEYVATTHSATSIGNSSLQMIENAYRGMVVRITRGKGKGQERSIASNTAAELAVSLAWDMEPDGSSYFVVAESGWRFGSVTKASPVQFEIPNRAGNTIHVSGRAANANDAESAVELCTVTRWMIGGSGAIDADVPLAPSFGFGISAKGGTIELVAVSFSSLTNTRTITAGTLTLYYWPELNGAPQLTLSTAIDAQATSIDLSAAGGAQPGSYIQLGDEVACVDQVLNNNTRYQVTRGVHGSTAGAHAAGTTLVYELGHNVYIVPFVRDFFGSPASGSWSYPIYLPDCRIASAELFVTNIKGAGPAGSVCLTSTVDLGLRTLSGGQYSFQVEAFLAIETGATPDIIVEESHAVRDVYAVLRQGPSGGPVELQINQNGDAYCLLTIADGATVSNSVSGLSLAPLTAGSRLSLDITAVGATSPGADLTVIIRL